MSSNPMPRSALSVAFLASSQAKTFTQDSIASCVPNRHTLASAAPVTTGGDYWVTGDSYHPLTACRPAGRDRHRFPGAMQ